MHNADFESAKPYVWARSPFLEWSLLLGPKRTQNIMGSLTPEQQVSWGGQVLDQIKYADSMPSDSPRLIKSHLPLSMLNPNLLDTCKVVYVSRHPMDVCVSYFYHTDLMGSNKFKGDIEAFAHRFMNGQIEYGDYWGHLKDAWVKKDHPNLKFLWYEDLKKNLMGVTRDLSKFLGRHLTELKILQIDDFLYIENYREFRSKFPKNDSHGARKFFRKGIVGDWRNHFKASLNTWEAWIERKKPAGLALPDSAGNVE